MVTVFDLNRAEIHGSRLNHTVLDRFRPFSDGIGSELFFTAELCRFLAGMVQYAPNQAIRSGSRDLPSSGNLYLFYILDLTKVLDIMASIEGECPSFAILRRER